MTEADYVQYNFRQMGVEIELLVRTESPNTQSEFRALESELQRLNDMLSRFDASSELERLNDAGGGHASPEIIELLNHAAAAQQVTEGRFTVGVGKQMVDAGYDQTFTQLDAPPEDQMAAFIEQLRVKPQVSNDGTPWAQQVPFSISDSGELTIEADTRLDVGGIAKGWAADKLCARLKRLGSCVVNIGGDLAVHVVDGEEGWPIGLDLGESSMTLATTFGGIATSGLDKRVWVADSDIAHHLIDPRTGKPAESDIRRVTLIGASALEAEIWTKALVMVGTQQAHREATDRGLTAVIVGFDDSVRCTGMLADVAIPAG